MPLYGCLTPDGYKNTEEWLSPDGTTRRIGVAAAWPRSAIRGELAISRETQSTRRIWKRSSGQP